MLYNGVVLCLPFSYNDIYISKDTDFILVDDKVLYDHNDSQVIGVIKKIFKERDCLFGILEIDDLHLSKFGIKCEDFSCNYKSIGLSVGGFLDKNKKVFYVEEISVTSFPAEDKTLGSGVFLKLNKSSGYNIHMNMNPQEIVQIITEIRDLLVQHEERIAALETKFADLEKIVLEIKDYVIVNQKTASENEVMLSKYKQQMDDILSQGMDMLKAAIETLKNNR